MTSFEDMSPSQKAKEKQAFAKRLGKQIKAVRESKQISQEALADKAGYHRTYIGNIENAVHLPSSHTVWRLAKALGVDVSDLMRGL